VRVSGVELDYAQVGKNRDQIVSQLHRGVEFLMKKHRIEVVRGRGRLDGPRRVRVAVARAATSWWRPERW